MLSEVREYYSGHLRENHSGVDKCARLLACSRAALKSVRRTTPLTAAWASQCGDDCDTAPRAASHRQQLHALCSSAQSRRRSGPVSTSMRRGRGDEVSSPKSNRWSHRSRGRSVTISGQIMARRRSTYVRSTFPRTDCRANCSRLLAGAAAPVINSRLISSGSPQFGGRAELTVKHARRVSRSKTGSDCTPREAPCRGEPT